MNALPVSLEPRIQATTFQKIPRIIYQTFKTNVMSDNMYGCAFSFIDLNPEYQYEFYDDERMLDYINNYDCRDFTFSNKELKKAFNNLAVPAGKADLWRYLIIYETGGIYIDIDAKCIKPFKDYIKPNDDMVTCIAGWSCNHNQPEIKWKHLFPQWMLINSKKSAALKQIIEECIKAINTKKPVPNSEDCLNMLERYTGACVSNFVYRNIFNFKSIEQENRLDIGAHIIKVGNKPAQISILPYLPNVFNGSIIEKDFLKMDDYFSELNKADTLHWTSYRKIFNDES